MVTALHTGHEPLDRPGRGVTPPPGTARLLWDLPPDVTTESLARHQARWGDLPSARSSELLDELERSGLRGHGGAWFPVATKWHAVRQARGRRTTVVVNAAEGEPASAKDRFLLTRRPHLVLDGAVLAARALGAGEIVVYGPTDILDVVHRAVTERRGQRIDHYPVRLVAAPETFIAGQESALVNAVNGLTAVPSFVRFQPVRERGVEGRPTLVQNAETLAHVAMILRFGAGWFRSVGADDSPGTALLTVTGRWTGVRIVEAPLGVPLGTTLGFAPGEAGSVAAVLLGGYGGGWIPTTEALAMPFTEEAARSRGASIGAGVVALLPADRCPLREAAAVVRYLESSGAGQCGPCVHGLAEMADQLGLLADEPRRFRGVEHLRTVCDLVEGRGACAHPDGAARFVRSTLQVFGDHAERHRRGQVCRSTAPFLPLPRPSATAVSLLTGRSSRPRTTS